MLCLLALLAACDNDKLPTNGHTPDNSSAPVLRAELDAALGQEIQRHHLRGDPVGERVMPSISSPKAQLGMQLFFSKALSGSLDVACATCHHPLLGGGDNLSLSIGVGALNPDALGHARILAGSKMPGVPRNAPTTFNIGLWQRFMFHDGRVGQLANGINTPDVPYPEVDPAAGASLVQAQARFPVTSLHEMRGEDFDPHGTAQSCRDLLAARLGGHAVADKPLTAAENVYWLAAFRQAFNAPQATAGELITEQNIALLLAEYQRSQVLVDNAWNAYVQGDATAIDEDAKRGALLFFRERDNGGFACASCHRGDFFTDEQFHNVLLPAIGPGKGENDQEPQQQQDFGRELVTGNPEDRYRFRTPSLLNVTATGPWGHNGAYTSLENMVRHMLNPFDAALAYDPQQLEQSPLQTGQLQQNLRAMLRENTDLPGQDYSGEDVRLLMAFLQTLTDPCVTDAACLARWIPDADTQSPMGLQLKAQFGH